MYNNNNKHNYNNNAHPEMRTMYQPPSFAYSRFSVAGRLTLILATFTGFRQVSQSGTVVVGVDQSLLKNEE